MKTTIKQIRNMVNVQGQDGNWNYNSYMHGMYNGLELALATLEDREPIFKDAPKKWLEDGRKNSTIKDRESLLMREIL